MMEKLGTFLVEKGLKHEGWQYCKHRDCLFYPLTDSELTIKYITKIESIEGRIYTLRHVCWKSSNAEVLSTAQRLCDMFEKAVNFLASHPELGRLNNEMSMECLKKDHQYKGMKWRYDEDYNLWVCATPIACLNIEAGNGDYWLYQFTPEDEAVNYIANFYSLDKAFEAAYKWLEDKLHQMENDTINLKQYLYERR